MLNSVFAEDQDAFVYFYAPWYLVKKIKLCYNLIMAGVPSANLSSQFSRRCMPTTTTMTGCL